MQLIDLEYKPPVFIIRLHGEGSFTPALLSEINAALDSVEACKNPCGVVFTGEGKCFSTGFDLDVFFKGTPGNTAALMDDAVLLLGRLLAFCLPSAAAINGHVFGMGAMLALACDYRVMREDRGFFCLPEIDLKVAIPPAMMELLKQKLQPAVLRDLLLSGRRVGGDEALRLGIIDAACGNAGVLPEALARAGALLGKDRATYGAMKRGMYHAVLSLIHGTT